MNNGSMNAPVARVDGAKGLSSRCDWPWLRQPSMSWHRRCRRLFWSALMAALARSASSLPLREKSVGKSKRTPIDLDCGAPQRISENPRVWLN